MHLNRIKSIFYPDRFQGWGKTKSYFEGWYFKIVSADCKNAFAIIPGIAMDDSGNKHSFIQVLNGKQHSAEYIKFDAADFRASKNKFEVSILNNCFNSQSVVLNLPNFKGTISFDENVKWPSKIYSPGIMGPFTFIPFMECYHGIVSMNHKLSGIISVNGEIIDFTNGKGYIEKDWGRSFPKAYIWMQTNHFSHENVSLKLSLATIPWLGKSFNGFIAGFWLNNKLYRFTTYNNSKVLKCEVDKMQVIIRIANKKYVLEIKAQRNKATVLAAPVNGLMEGKIEESMTSKIAVTLSNSKTNKIIFEGTGDHSAIEVAGKIELLIL